jgi:hypothetical protein
MTLRTAQITGLYVAQAIVFFFAVSFVVNITVSMGYFPEFAASYPYKNIINVVTISNLISTALFIAFFIYAFFKKIPLIFLVVVCFINSFVTASVGVATEIWNRSPFVEKLGAETYRIPKNFQPFHETDGQFGQIKIKFSYPNFGSPDYRRQQDRSVLSFDVAISRHIKSSIGCLSWVPCYSEVNKSEKKLKNRSNLIELVKKYDNTPTDRPTFYSVVNNEKYQEHIFYLPPQHGFGETYGKCSVIGYPVTCNYTFSSIDYDYEFQIEIRDHNQLRQTNWPNRIPSTQVFEIFSFEETIPVVSAGAVKLLNSFIVRQQ